MPLWVGPKERNQYAGVVDLHYLTFQVVNPTTNTLIPSARGVIPSGVVRLLMPFLEGIFSYHNPHPPLNLTCTKILPPLLSGSHNRLICLLQHSVHTLRQGRVRQVLPQGLTQPVPKTYAFCWYVEYLSCRCPFHPLHLLANVLFGGVFALASASSLGTQLGTTILSVFAKNSSSTLRFESVQFLRHARLPCLYRPAGDYVRLSGPLVSIPCLSSFHTRVRPQNLLHWAICLLFLLLHNFSTICTT